MMMTLLFLLVLSGSAATTLYGQVDGDEIILSRPSEVCGQELGGARDYILGASINCGEDSGPTLTGTATLDCRKHNIEGSKTTKADGVTLHDTTILKNCFVYKFKVGIVFGDSDGTRSLLNTESGENSLHGIMINSAGESFLQSVSSTDNRYYGIYVARSSGAVTIQRASVNTSHQGIVLKKDVKGFVVITESDISDNEHNAIVIHSKQAVTISKGTIESNGGSGIVAPRAGAPGRLHIYDVTIKQNFGTGIFLSGFHIVDVEDSKIIENGREGIRLC